MTRWSRFAAPAALAATMSSAGCVFDTSVIATNVAETDGGPPIIDGALGDDASADAQASFASGFSAEPERWTLPETGRDEGFFQANVSTGSALNWRLVDVDGNGSLELVQTADPAVAEPFSDVSGPFWRVFANTGTGFETTGTPMRLPGLDIGNLGFYATRGPGWDYRDLDNDGIPDLIVFTDPDTGQLWEAGADTSWQVYKSTGTAFELPVAWPVPNIDLDLFGAIEACADATGCWEVVDINDDGFPDLVHSAEANDPPSVWDADTTPNWHVYLNNASGFASSMVAWLLPVPSHARGFFHPNQDAYWQLIDLNGDTQTSAGSSSTSTQTAKSNSSTPPTPPPTKSGATAKASPAGTSTAAGGVSGDPSRSASAACA